MYVLATGLTSAIYFNEDDLSNLKQVSPKDDKAGLYIRTRGKQVVKVNIPADCIAFQMGQALELVSKGKLQATPHCVRGCRTQNMGKVARNTFAVFMQPNIHDEVKPGVSFAQFAKSVFDSHY
jgi:isopenicillin N synthase-like dioxygenase